MKKIQAYESFNISESQGKYTPITDEDMRIVEKAKIDDVSKDGPHKAAMIKVLESAMNYFETQQASNEIDTKAKLVSKASDADGLQEMLDLAKIYVQALKKIRRIEQEEISTVNEQINNLVK